MQVQAAVLPAPGSPFQLEELTLLPPRAGEVLVRVKAAGVCHSDWHLATGDTKHPLPLVAGHEGAGVVVETGPGVTHVASGDHVALNWSPSCGQCFYCLNETPYLCSTYVETVWGGVLQDGETRLRRGDEPVYHYCALACFADHTVVDQTSCVALPKEVPFEVAALIGCAVTTGVGAVLNTANVTPGSSVAVFGAGGVGLSAIMGAKLAGAHPIIAIDRNEAKRETALAFGATDFVTAKEASGREYEALTAGPVVQGIRQLTAGRGADYTIEAVGLSAVQELCLAAARPGGTIVLAGLSPMGTTTNLPGAVITREEKTVKGSYYGSSHGPRDFPQYAEFFQRGQLDLGRLISRRYQLAEINEGFAAMLAGDAARGVITWD
ncbi:MAG: Zn-dependent alcohol dehydrogenase [Pirellulales bacterium]|nr:Zn-dependent alcohol dehydrogenase [Pirellulales bacterium]